MAKLSRINIGYIKQKMMPRAFEYWDRKLGFGNRVEIQATHYFINYPLRMLDFAYNQVSPKPSLRLEKSITWAENRIEKLQTERKQAAENLQKTNQLLEEMFNNATVWLSLRDENNNVIRWNKAAEKISGYSEEEVIGHNKIWEWVYPDEKYRTELFLRIAETINRGEPVENLEVVVRCKDGQTRILSWDLKRLMDKNKEYKGLLVIGHDITERKLADAALVKSEEQFRKMFETIPLGSAISEIIYDEAGNAVNIKILDVNPAYEKILGRKKEDVIGKIAGEFYKEIDPSYVKVFNTFVRVAESGEPETFERTFEDGRTFKTSVFSHEKGKIITVFDDVTEEKQTQQERETLKAAAARAETIEEVSKTIAHEVRNPLFAILSGIQILQDELKLDKEAEETFQIVLGEIERMDDLIGKFRALGAREELKRGPTDVPGLTGDVISLHRGLLKAKGLKVKKSIVEGMPLLNVDKDKITQIIINILQNAVHASPEGETIEIACRMRVDKKKQFLLIQVMDKGGGIAEENLEKIFKPFFTTKKKEKDSGMGLAISMKYAHAHGGTIQAENRKDKEGNIVGATFTIELPLNSETNNSQIWP